MKPTKNSLTICICIPDRLAACRLLAERQPAVVGAPSLQGNASLHISAATLQVSQERSVSRAVTSDALTAGSIGVFRSQGTGYAEAQDNKEYSYVSGVWQPKVPAQTVHLMANDARVCAYYPYNAAYTNKTAIPLPRASTRAWLMT